MDRRGFLVRVAYLGGMACRLGLLGPLLPRISLGGAARSPPYWLVSGEANPPGFDELDPSQVPDVLTHLVYWHSSWDQIRRVECPYPIHSVLHHPSRPGEWICYSLRKPWAAAFSVRTKAFTRIYPSKGRLFYGHGCFDSGGKIYYSSEQAFGSRKSGAIVARDARTHQILFETPSGGSGPHDLRFHAASGKILACNTDPNLRHSRSSLAAIDLRRRAARVLYTEKNPRIRLRHLELTGSDRLVILPQIKTSFSDSELRPVPYFGTLRGDHLALLTGGIAPELAGKFLSEQLLSVVIDEQGRECAITCPSGGSITRWALEDGRFLGGEEFAGAMPLAPAPGSMAIAAGSSQPDIPLRILHDPMGNQSRLRKLAGFTGSHLIMIPDSEGIGSS